MSFLWCARAKTRVGHNPPSPEVEFAPTIQRSEQPGGEPRSPDRMPPLDLVHRLVEFHPDPTHYQLLTVIGNGCNESAVVSLAKHVPSGTHVAVKRINLETCDLEFSSLQNEVLMHRVLHHPNVMESLCSFVHNQEIWIVMPLMAFGSCKDLLHAHFREGLSEQAIAHILREVLQALEYLHVRNVIHRSVRASHILVSASGRVCLSGLRHLFNMVHDGKRVRAVHDFPNHFVKSLLWASPELLQQNLHGYNTKSDIYSVGILACELANGVAPFEGMQPTELLLQKVCLLGKEDNQDEVNPEVLLEKVDNVTPQLLDSNTLPDLQLGNGDTNMGNQVDCEVAGNGVVSGMPPGGGNKIPYQRTFSQSFHNFVAVCLIPESSKRPDAGALLQHTFFKQIKRKSSPESLPELLQPVTPLSDHIANFPKDESAVDSLTTDLESATMEDSSWNF